MNSKIERLIFDKSLKLGTLMDDFSQEELKEGFTSLCQIFDDPDLDERIFHDPGTGNAAQIGRILLAWHINGGRICQN